MITKEQSIEFLISTPINYSCTQLAEHLSGISHESMTDFVRSQRLTAQSVWSSAKMLIRDTAESFLSVDDRVQEKPPAKAIEFVTAHDSGTKHGEVRGIDRVNLVHSSADADYYPIDTRISAPDYAKDTKND